MSDEASTMFINGMDNFSRRTLRGVSHNIADLFFAGHDFPEALLQFRQFAAHQPLSWKYGMNICSDSQRPVQAIAVGLIANMADLGNAVGLQLRNLGIDNRFPDISEKLLVQGIPRLEVAWCCSRKQSTEKRSQ
jgi:hypothetical protein